MTTIELISAVLHLCLAASLLWILVFYFWRQHRVDALRERLFRIRGELFDYADSGEVSFDDPAYAKLRVVMNGMIRFAHRFTFFRLALMVLFSDVLEKVDVENPLSQWEEALQRIPTRQQKRLRELHDKMMGTIIVHVTTGSPILCLVFGFYILCSIASGTIKRLDRDEVNKLGRQLPGVDTLEVQAINAELGEEENALEPVTV
jgi:hypothetical protein